MSRQIVPGSRIEADIELGSDGNYYIKRKVSASELESLRRIPDDRNPYSIFFKDIRAVDSSRDSDRWDYDPSKRRRTPVFVYPPLFITFISLFQLVTFIYYALRSDEPLTLTGPIPFDSKLIYNPHRRYEIWRYVTYMLVHAGFWHISCNLLLQLIVGIPLELAHKFERIFVIYIGGVLAGSLGNSIADPYSYLAGASSGCYALVTAHLSNLIMNWTEIRCALCKFLLISAFVFIDLSIAIYERHYKVSLTPHRTSYGGHLGGMLGGFLLGILFLRNVRPRSWERFARYAACFLYVTLQSFGIVFNIVQSDYFTPPDKRGLTWATNPFGYQREN